MMGSLKENNAVKRDLVKTDLENCNTYVKFLLKPYNSLICLNQHDI